MTILVIRFLFFALTSRMSALYNKEYKAKKGDEHMANLFQNRPLSEWERKKLHEEEQKVVAHYEKVTRLTFMRYDVPLLKKCIKHATPEAINQLISTFYYRYPQNFKDFNYIVPPVVNGMLWLSRSKKSKK